MDAIATAIELGARGPASDRGLSTQRAGCCLCSQDHAVRAVRHHHEATCHIEGPPLVREGVDHDRAHCGAPLARDDNAFQCVGEEYLTEPLPVEILVKREFRDEGRWHRICHAATDARQCRFARNGMRAQRVVRDHDIAVIGRPDKGLRDTRTHGACRMSPQPVIEGRLARVESRDVVYARVEGQADERPISGHAARCWVGG